MRTALTISLERKGVGPGSDLTFYTISESFHPKKLSRQLIRPDGPAGYSPG